MKSSILFAITTLIILQTKLYAQDTAFFDHNWSTMMEEGADYQTITNRANNAYADTAYRNKEFNYHHYLRWNDFWKNRVYSSEQDLELEKYGMFYHHSNAVATAFGNQSPCPSHPDAYWESWGFNTHPKTANGSKYSRGGMGVMHAIVADTTDPSLQILYAGSPLGGIWKSTNQGNSWFNISDTLHSVGMSITDIKIDPKDNQHLLVATGARWTFGPPGVGVIESFDGGITWSQTGLKNTPIGGGSLNKHIQKVYFHPTDTNKYYAISNNVLHISYDQGDTWIPNGFPSKLRLLDIKFHPLYPDTFYLSSTSTDVTSARLYRSFNGGTTMYNITPNIVLGGEIAKIISIDVTPDRPDGLYVAYSVEKNNRMKFKVSHDLGNNIDDSSSRVNLYNQYPGSYHGNGKDVFMVSPTDENKMIVGGIYLYNTTTGIHGFTLISESLNLYHLDMRGESYVEGLAMLATDGGISISTDDGATWTNRYNGLNVQQCYGHDIDENFNYLITGCQDVGEYRYDTELGNWTNCIISADGGIPIISNKVTSKSITNLFHGSGGINDNRLQSSSNNGLNYSDILKSNRPSYLEKHLVNRPLAQDTNGNFYMGYEDLYKSTNSGLNWTKISDFEGQNWKNRRNTNEAIDAIVAVGASPVDSAILAIGFEHPTYYRNDSLTTNCPLGRCPEKKFFLTINGGITWLDRTKGSNSINLPVEFAQISDIILSPNDAGKIWVSFGGYAEYLGTVFKVYFSPDTGKSWYNHSYDLPNVPVHSIVCQEGTNDRLYIATDAGVFTKDASTSSWECYNKNMPVAYYVDLDINSCAGALTVSSQGRGIWKSPLAANVISGTHTWSGNHYIGSNLTIEDTITVTGTVKVAPNVKITVAAGGKLIVDGGTITSSQCLDGIWQGIELLGDPTKGQSGDPMSGTFSQGYIKLTNGAIIENAITGIYIGNMDESAPNEGGGLVHMEDGSTIKNCRIGIEASPYHNKYTKSTYKSSFFYNDNSFTDPATGNPLITEAFVVLNGTHIIGHEFDTMEFKVFNSANFNENLRGGIIINGRRLGTTANPFVQNCLFENLSYGIRSGNLTTGVGNDIEDNEFKKVQRGVYVLAGYSFEIKNNDFTLPDMNTSNDFYGIMVAGANNYTIEKNDITGAITLPSQPLNGYYGIVIENSGLAGATVFDNKIQPFYNGQMDICIQAQGDNQSLTIRCNSLEYTNSQNQTQQGYTHGLTVYDIPGGNSAQLRDQGHPNCGGSNPDDKAAAGNKWENLCTSSSHEDIDQSLGVIFDYYGHNQDINGTFKTKPLCSESNWYSMHFTNCLVAEQQSSCNSIYTPPAGGGGGPGPGGLRLKSGADSSRIVDYYVWYRSLLVKQQKQINKTNGTQTETNWLQSISNSSNSNSLYQNLYNASPLSDALLNALIDSWSSTNDSLLKNILIKNVPLGKQQLLLLQHNNLSATWAKPIFSANVQYILRDSLVQLAREIRFAKKEIQLAEAKFYRELMAANETKSAYKLLDTSLFSASLQLLAKEYLIGGFSSEATQLLNRLKIYDGDNNLKNNVEFAKFYLKLLPMYKNGNANNTALIDEQLLSTTAFQKGNLGAEAEALLQAVNKQFTHHTIVRPQRVFQANKPSGLANKVLTNFSLYPNPTDGNATLAYELSGKTAALWQLFDVNGRLVMQLSLPVGAQQQQLNVSNLSNGVYHFSVLVNQERIQNGKMVITRK